MILTTTLPTDTALAVSHLSSHSSRRMAQHPAVSDTLRAVLTSQRSPTYLLQFTCSRSHRHGPPYHPLIDIYPSCLTHHRIHHILLAVSHLVIDIDRSDLTHHRTRRILLAVIVAGMVLPAIFLIDIYPSRLTCYCTCRFLLAVVLAGWVLPAILLLIGIITVASCLPSYSPPGWCPTLSPPTPHSRDLTCHHTCLIVWHNIPLFLTL